ncbi:MAG: tRNA 2-thiocytidine(32) synthetase TtcA [Pseudomonadota bacterium]|nr:tRNA 2-thiocytidine(32) synthetase TtcA [Pseudomonadota bacterium]
MPDLSAQAKSNRQGKKLKKRLRREVGRAIADYNMIEQGDRVMVCLSGGKDSFAMLDILRELQRRAPIDFELLAVNLDQKQPGFPENVLPDYLQSEGVPYRILEQDTYSLVTEMVPQGKTYCGWCSRFRRGIIYKFAKRNGYNKIALGHHRDDIIETLFLNLFHAGKLKAMPAKLLSDDGENIVIRPLAYCKEVDLIRYAELQAFPIIPCNLCGSQDNLQRQVIKEMLNGWQRQFPGRVETIFKSLADVAPSQLLDGGLFDFNNLEKKRVQQLDLQQLDSQRQGSLRQESEQ